MMKTKAESVGDKGESAAAALLQRKGYSVLERNYRTRYGEIDIIAQDGQYIVFAEVKTRASDAIGKPSVWVDARKQKKLLRTAGIYMEEHTPDLQPRFDIIEVVYDKITGSVVSLVQSEDAFGQTEDYSAY